MRKKDLVSVIIPVYNGERFIKDTINSVLGQSYHSIEIIVVNDGSTDNTLSIVKSINNTAITIKDQKNTGVSEARNNGSLLSNGEYICFFDADDIMPASFVFDRVNFLRQNKDFSFCCSDVVTIDEEKNELDKSAFKLLTTNGINEILLYSPVACSTPSSFMFNFNFLGDNNISFHSQLSNTADRLFILDCCKKGQGGYFGGSPFYHTVYRGSMSSIISNKILTDFKLYVSLLQKRDYIPQAIKRQCLELNYRILCGLTKKTGNYLTMLRYFFMYIFFKYVKSNS